MPLSTPLRTVLCISDTEILPDAAEVTNLRTTYAASPQRARDLMTGTVLDALVVVLPVTGYSASELVRELRGRTDTAILVYDPLLTTNGAMDGCEYIGGPASAGELLERVSQAIRRRNGEVSQPAHEAGDWASGLVGSSSAMRQVIEIIRLVGPRRSTVMITGETGSG